PLLPRNPWLPDWLLEEELAQRVRGRPHELKPLEDELEGRAHEGFAGRARRRRAHRAYAARGRARRTRARGLRRTRACARRTLLSRVMAVYTAIDVGVYSHHLPCRAAFTTFSTATRSCSGTEPFPV